MSGGDPVGYAQDHYPQGIVWEYDVDKPFRLHAWAAEFIELTYLEPSFPDIGQIDVHYY